MVFNAVAYIYQMLTICQLLFQRPYTQPSKAGIVFTEHASEIERNYKRGHTRSGRARIQAQAVWIWSSDYALMPLKDLQEKMRGKPTI